MRNRISYAAKLLTRPERSHYGLVCFRRRRTMDCIDIVFSPRSAAPHRIYTSPLINTSFWGTMFGESLQNGRAR